MLQNGKVTAFTISELLRGNQQGAGRGGEITSPLLPPTYAHTNTPRLGLKGPFLWWHTNLLNKRSSKLILLNLMIPRNVLLQLLTHIKWNIVPEFTLSGCIFKNKFCWKVNYLFSIDLKKKCKAYAMEVVSNKEWD